MADVEMTRRIRVSPDFDERMAAARRRAEWEIGDPSWAGIILGAFLHPEEDSAHLIAEKRD